MGPDQGWASSRMSFGTNRLGSRIGCDSGPPSARRQLSMIRSLGRGGCEVYEYDPRESQMDIATIVAAGVAAFAALVAAGIAAVTALYVRRRDRQLLKAQQSTDFLQAQLDNIYLPVAISLSITNQLFDRYFQSTTTDSEKEVIEHAWKLHNSEAFERLTRYQVYMDPGGPTKDVDDLIEHLQQWDSVYRLKYTEGTYSGPVFAGIRQFGFKGFPRPDRETPPRQALDVYFKQKAELLRNEIHRRPEPVE